MQNDRSPDKTAKPQPDAATTPTSQAARPALDPAAAAEIDRFIAKHHRLLEKLS